MTSEIRHKLDGLYRTGCFYDKVGAVGDDVIYGLPGILGDRIDDMSGVLQSMNVVGNPAGSIGRFYSQKPA